MITGTIGLQLVNQCSNLASYRGTVISLRFILTCEYILTWFKILLLWLSLIQFIFTSGTLKPPKSWLCWRRPLRCQDFLVESLLFIYFCHAFLFLECRITLAELLQVVIPRWVYIRWHVFRHHRSLLVLLLAHVATAENVRLLSCLIDLILLESNRCPLACKPVAIRLCQFNCLLLWPLGALDDHLLNRLFWLRFGNRAVIRIWSHCINI